MLQTSLENIWYIVKKLPRGQTITQELLQVINV